MPAVLAHLVDRHDVRMIQARRRLRLGTEASVIRTRRPLAAKQHFDRHNASQAQLPCAVHDAHATAANLLDQFVVAESIRQFQRWA